MKFIVAFVAFAQAIKISGYNGPLPAQFDSAQLGDPFMEKVIRQYGETVKKGDKEQIVISRDNARQLATTVWENGLEQRPFDARNHLDGAFSSIWNHFDVLAEGKISIDQLPSFYRMVAADTSMQLTEGSLAPADDGQPKWLKKFTD